MSTDATVKGLEPSSEHFDGSKLRVAIVHARWNRVIIDALVAGTVGKLKERGVLEQNIVVETVPGSFELPFAVSRVIAGSQVQTSSTAADLLGSSSILSALDNTITAPSTKVSTFNGPFDAVIAIGVLIKGSTMHFEYICDAVSHGLMRIQLDTGVPVIFGVLTALTDDQALERAGLGRKDDKGHNHGEDWGHAAVEMGVNTKQWSRGTFKRQQ
ncbi:hypothetical protein FRB96_004586 [Tulasnella sp. 330]|nr:hypothetical protein FRB96_004586 [Tulasnella sp. 330]KAG8869166.1 hypothetical protein FRB98_002808 [Tulasnella sp. 332]